MYDNQHDASQYLKRSVIRYKKEAVLVEGVEGRGGLPLLFIRNLKTNEQHLIKVDSPNLDYSPVPLGYGEINGQAFYICRQPARRWKQGLAQESIRCLGGGMVELQYDRLAHRKVLATIITGKYKSFKKAKEEGGAFHRNFAIDIIGRKRHLEYKGRRIGTLVAGRIALEERYDYLENLLEELV